MTSITVFAGPSLPPECRRNGQRFDWRPPAAAGDLLALLDRPPARLCLIDGFFDACPAPWHKELLLLMSAGTIVFGASSMGALRAAELDRFGMIGVGAIYRAYRDGLLTGDDEVALVHAPGRLGWAPLSVPMVEMRATLVAACRVRLISTATARRLRDLVHDIHFDSRDWPLMRTRCVDAGLIDAETFARLEAMHVPLKRADALACLVAAATAAAPCHSAPPVTPYTCFIEELARARCKAPAPPPRKAGCSPQATDDAA